MPSGPDRDRLQYSQATRWFTRPKVLSASAEQAVLAADMLQEDCQDVKEVAVTAVSGIVEVSNREDGTFKTIPEGSTFVIPLSGAEQYVWLKGAGAVAEVTAFGYSVGR